MCTKTFSRYARCFWSSICTFFFALRSEYYTIKSPQERLHLIGFVCWSAPCHFHPLPRQARNIKRSPAETKAPLDLHEDVAPAALMKRTASKYGALPELCSHGGGVSLSWVCALLLAKLRPELGSRYLAGSPVMTHVC